MIKFFFFKQNISKLSSYFKGHSDTMKMLLIHGAFILKYITTGGIW